MTRTQISTLAIALSALLAGPAMATDNSTITRDQVKAELAQAVRTGNVITEQSGRFMKDIFPSRYPAQVQPSETRAQVKAELNEAIRTGNMSFDQSGRLMKDVFANNYPAPAASTVTRAEVRAELADAVRTGDIIVGQSGKRLNQLFPSRYATTHAVAAKTHHEATQG